jgi:hypothetical protein
MMHEKSTGFVLGPSSEHTVFADAFVQWYRTAQPGEKFLYYFGEHLHEDRNSEYVRQIVWDYACDGKVYIFQARDKEHPTNFNFIAVKSRHKLDWLIPARTAA